jgi:hypothetical protein
MASGAAADDIAAKSRQSDATVAEEHLVCMYLIASIDVLAISVGIPGS